MKRMINNNDVEELMIKVEELIHGKTFTQTIKEHPQDEDIAIPSGKINLDKGIIIENLTEHTKYLFVPKYNVEDEEWNFWMYERSDSAEAFYKSTGEEVSQKLQSLSLNSGGAPSYIGFGGQWFFRGRDDVKITYWECDNAFGGIEL